MPSSISSTLSARHAAKQATRTSQERAAKLRAEAAQLEEQENPTSSDQNPSLPDDSFTGKNIGSAAEG